MPWAEVCTVAISAYAASASAAQRETMLSNIRDMPEMEKPLEVQGREHRAAVKEQLATIQAEAKTGAYILAGLLVACAVGVARLLGAV